MSRLAKFILTILGGVLPAFLRNYLDRVEADGGATVDRDHIVEVYEDTNPYNPTLIQSCESGKATVAYSLFAFDDVDDFELRVVADGGTNVSTRQDALVAQHLWRNNLHNNASLVVPCASYKAGRLYAYQPTVEPDTTLLDYYTGAAAAYSLRSLSASTTNVVKVRRDSDNAELDFTASDISNGTLTSWVNTDVQVMTNPDITSATGWTIAGNTTYNASTEAFDLLNENGLTVRQGKAIAGLTYDITLVVDSFSSGGIKVYVGGTQSAVISSAGTYNLTITAGSTNTNFGINPDGTASCSISSFYATQTISNGFVTTWYDQSGNGNNATQATAANQPKIVSAGSLVTENEKAAIDFDGVNDELSLGTALTNTTNTTNYFAVFTTSDSDGIVFGGNNPSFYDSYGNALYINNSDIKGKALNNNVGVLLESGITPSGTYLVSLLLKSGDSSIYVNSIQKATSANSLQNWNYITGIGGGQYTTDNLDGTIQEIIFYTSDKSANRTDIEGNINDYYNIYP